MAKVKLGAIEDLRPVRLTIERLRRQRDCFAYAESWRARQRKGLWSPPKTDRADARSLHGERARLCQGEGDHF
jgi:endonuclease YncB( thermonuclease family)